MPTETKLDFTCPICHHAWIVDLKDLEVIDQVIYRDAENRRKEQYRVRCPKCGAYAIADVLIEES